MIRPAVAPVAWGLSPGDGICRRELAEHIRALCSALHGPRRSDCTACAALTSPSPVPSDGPPAGGGEQAFWAGAAALALIPTAALAAVVQVAIR